jgi:hypothetical protein
MNSIGFALSFVAAVVDVSTDVVVALGVVSMAIESVPYRFCAKSCSTCSWDAAGSSTRSTTEYSARGFIEVGLTHLEFTEI